MANQWQGQKYDHISTATTTLVKTGRGFLHGFTLNTTAAGAITLYDGLDAGGTVIGIFAASAAIGQYPYNIQFGVGLTIVTGAASDLTVSYS